MKPPQLAKQVALARSWEGGIYRKPVWALLAKGRMNVQAAEAWLRAEKAGGIEAK